MTTRFDEVEQGSACKVAVRRERPCVPASVVAALVVALGAALGATPGASAQPIRFDTLTVEAGLSQSHVAFILQDSVGFMWWAGKARNANLSKYKRGFHDERIGYRDRHRHCIEESPTRAAVQLGAGVPAADIHRRVAGVAI
jgi:hypothetical protein